MEKQNAAIYERERQLANVEKELAGAKGIFKAKLRKELQEQAEQLKIQIASMKQYLSSIVQGYGYKNVIFDIAPIVLLSGIFGARLYFCIFNYSY